MVRLDKRKLLESDSVFSSNPGSLHAAVEREARGEREQPTHMATEMLSPPALGTGHLDQF